MLPSGLFCVLVVYALTQPPNQPTTFVDGAKIQNTIEIKDVLLSFFKNE